MEKKLFTYEGVDPLDPDFYGYAFWDARLKIDLGPFKKGDKFERINLNYETGVIEFFKQDDKKPKKLKLKLVVA